MRLFYFLIILFVGIEQVVAQRVSYELCRQADLIHNQTSYNDCIDYEKNKLNLRAALDLAYKASRKYPYNYNFRLKKALLYESLGNRQSAEKEIIGLIRLYPEKQELHNYLGRMHYSVDKSKSLLALLTSISINPKSTMSKENLVFVRRLLDGRTKHKKVENKHNKLHAYRVDDFDEINMLISKLPKEREISCTELEQRLSKFFEALSLYNHRKEGFFWNNYAPRFIEIYEKNNTEAFVNYITENQSSTHK